MERPAWLNNKTATIFGVICFPIYVLFAYRLNKYMLDASEKGGPMSGGRLAWRQYGWSLLNAIPFFGLIYGLKHLDDIIETRNKVWDIIQKNQQPAQ